MRQILRGNPGVGLHPNGVGIDPSQVGNKVAWFLNRTDQLTTTDISLTTWLDNFAANDITQATAANKPLALLWNSQYKNYIYFPGISGNSCSSPDSAAADITGDIDIRVIVAPNAWASNNMLISKWGSAGNRSYNFYIDSSAKPVIQWSTNGTTALSVTSNVAITATDYEALAVRAVLVVDEGGSHVVRFYTSVDNGSTWVQLNIDQYGIGVTSIFSSTASLTVGYNTSNTSGLTGKLFNAVIRNGVNGTVAVNFNADRGNSYSDTFTATTGEVWTIARTSTDGYKAILVDENVVMFDGVADYLKGAFTLNQPCTIYLMARQFVWASSQGIFDGNTINTGQLQQNAVTPNVRIYAGGSAVQNTNFTLSTWKIITVIFDGASSFIKVNQTADPGTTGNAGSANMGGVTIGARGDNSNPSCIAVKEMIIYGAAHDAATQTSLRLNMANRHKYTMN